MWCVHCLSCSPARLGLITADLGRLGKCHWISNRWTEIVDLLIGRGNFKRTVVSLLVEGTLRFPKSMILSGSTYTISGSVSSLLLTPSNGHRLTDI